MLEGVYRKSEGREPLVEGDRVFIMPGGLDGQSLAALDKLTGKILWKKHNDRASYSSPVAATFHKDSQILFLTGGRLVSVNPETGLLEEPMKPTRLPETVEKKKPTKSMTTAASTAGQTRPEI